MTRRTQFKKIPTEPLTVDNIPKGQIRFIVGNHHVSDSDAVIEADIRERCGKGASAWTPELIDAAVAYALQEHHENQGIYNSVMTGRF